MIDKETALINIKCHADLALDHGEGTVILSRDLSAAFDTLDYALILERLSQCVGVRGTVLKWFETYLAERRQCVRIVSTQSHSVDLSPGLPQGSVLGPLIFLVYMLPLNEVLGRYRVMRHGFSDDNQIYSHSNLRLM